jgi:outer membrane murein-binding lipoprotein Lpp
MRKGKNRYIVEVNEWGCGLMIKDTQTGNEIDAPEDEVITLCIKEMNSLAKELDTVRSVAEDNQAELKATRIENARLKAEVEKLTFDPMSYLDDQGEWMPRHTHLAASARLKAEAVAKDYLVTQLKAEVERLRKHGDAMAEALEAAGFNNARDFWNAAKEGKGQP